MLTENTIQMLINALKPMPVGNNETIESIKNTIADDPYLKLIGTFYQQ